MKLPAIKGFQEISLLDWDGKIASIIFLGGCNFRCGFCHSSNLVLNYEKLESIPFTNIDTFLRKKRGWVDGVVITGGEPTLDEAALFNLAAVIRGLGFLVKLDTNGTKPNTLKNIIGNGTVNYIAMDIKAPLSEEAYNKATGVKVDIKDIILSKDIILNSGIDYEFRTTVIPGIIGAAEITEIAKSLSCAKKYCLQQFVPRDTLDPSFLKVKPYSSDELNSIAAIASKYLSKVVARG